MKVIYKPSMLAKIDKLIAENQEISEIQLSLLESKHFPIELPCKYKGVRICLNFNLTEEFIEEYSNYL